MGREVWGVISGSQPLLTPLLEVWGPSQGVLPQIEASQAPLTPPTEVW